jgi:hypothetical protein
VAPAPDEGSAKSHASVIRMVQAHPPGATRVSSIAPPLAPSSAGDGDTLKRHCAGSWEMSTRWSSTTMLP